MARPAGARQNVSDRMTQAHFRAALPARHGEPDRELAIEPRFEVIRGSLHLWQGLAQQPQCLYVDRIALRIGRGRTEALGCVVDPS